MATSKEETMAKIAAARKSAATGTTATATDTQSSKAQTMAKIAAARKSATTGTTTDSQTSSVVLARTDAQKKTQGLAKIASAREAAGLEEGTGNTGYEPGYVDVSPSQTASRAASTGTAASTGKSLQEKWAIAQTLSGSKYPAVKAGKEETPNLLLRQAAPTGTSGAAQQRIENKNSDYAQELAAGEADDEAVARLIAMESYAGDSWAERQARNIRSNQSAGGDYNGNITNEKLYQYYNEWLDETDETGAQKNRQLAKAVRRVDGSNGMYTDEELRKALGVTQAQIDVARTYNNAYDTMTPLYSLLRRTAEDVGGTYDTVLGSGAMALGNAKTALEDTKANLTNTDWLTRNAARMALEETPEDQRNEAWAQQLEAAQSALDEVTQATASRNGVTQYGNDLYKEGNALLSDAQLGQTDAAKFVHGAAVSAGENLAVGAINPALILPVLSLQGAGDSLAESYESGEDAGTALVRGGAKFAAGWAINSVGVTQLAETMGSEYAASTLAKQIAQKWRDPKVLAKLAESAPAIYAAITGGVDNMVQAFAETYADKVIDNVVDGKDPTDGITMDTLYQALQAGASGGLAGAMGGFLGSGIGTARQRAQEQAYQQAYEQAVQEVQEAQAAEQTEAAADTEPAAQTPAEQIAQEALRAATTGQETQAEKITPQTEQAAQSEEQAAQETAKEEQANNNNTEDTTRANESAETETEQAEEHAQKEGQIINEEAADKQTVIENSQKNEQETPAETKAEVRQLDTSAWDAQQKQSAAQMLEAGRVSTAAVQTIVDAMPAGINAEIYTTAARSVYRLARTANVNTTFESILSQTQNYVGVNAAQVMAVQGGENALRQAFVVGQGELKANGREMANYQAPVLAQESEAGQVVNKSSTRTEGDKAFIDLAAKAGDIGIELQERLKNNAKGYIEDAKIHVSDEGGALSTTLHELLHDADSWSHETAQNLADVLLRALTKQSGFETVERMIEAKIETYQKAGKELTWADAANELVNDAVSGAFDSEESMRELGEVMAKEAEKNAERRGAMQKVADCIRAALDKVIEKAREILNGDRSNAAARKVMALAEAQKKAIREAFYEHLEQAGENRRAAENKNARAEEGTGEVKYQEREYPQAGMSGEEQVSYDTLVNLPDMKITRIANSVPAGTDFHAVIADAMENMGATRDSTHTTVTNQYTGMEIVVHKKGLLHSMHMDRQLARNGPYVQQIGSILENAVKVNELESRGKEYRSDLYLGAAQNENGELVGVRLNVQVYKNGEAVLDGENIELLRGNLYSHTGTKIGTTAPMSVRTGHAASSAPSHSSYLSVADFLQAVKENLAGVVSEDVKANIQSTAETPREFENSLRYQLSEENTQRGESEEVTQVWNQGGDEGVKVAENAVEALQGVKFKAETVQDIARQYIRNTDSKATITEVSKQLQAVFDYIGNAESPDLAGCVNVLHGVVEDMLSQSNTMDETLWNQYEDLHSFDVYVKKGSPLYNDLAYTYGSWNKARQTLGKSGVNISTSMSTRNGAMRQSTDSMYEMLAKDHPEWFDAGLTSGVEQLERMADVWAAIRPQAENNFGNGQDSETWEESVADYTNLMLQDILTKPEVTDKVDTSALRSELATSLELIRGNAAQRMLDNSAMLRDVDKIKADKRLQGVENSYKRTLQKRSANYQDRMKNMREMRDVGIWRPKVKEHANTFIKSYEHPNKNYHAGAQVMAELADVAKLTLEVVKTGEDRTEHLQRLQELLYKANSASGGETKNQAVTRGGDTYDYKASGIPELLQELCDRLGQKRGLNRLNTEDLKVMDKLLRAANKYVKDSNRLQGQVYSKAQRENVNEYVQSVINRANEARVQLDKYKGKDARKAIRNYELQTLGAERAARLMENYSSKHELSTIMQDLNQGQTKYLRIRQQCRNYFADLMGKENRATMNHFTGMTADLIDVGLVTRNADGTKGETVKITGDELAALALHLRNGQNRNHILNGGMTIPDRELYQNGRFAEAYEKGVTCTLDLSNPDALNRVLEAYDQNSTAKAWGERAHEYWNGMQKNILNKASVETRGYEMFTEEDYIPMNCDKNYIQKEFDGSDLVESIENAGPTKSRRIGAENPIMLVPLTDALNNSINFAAKYAGLAMPIRNATKILNGVTDGYGDSVRGAITRAYGSVGVEVFEKHIKNLQQTERGSAAWNRLRSNYAKGTLTMNVKTALSQAASLPTAIPVLGYKAIVKALPTFLGNTANVLNMRQKLIAESNEHSPLMQLRQEGNNTYYGFGNLGQRGGNALTAKGRKANAQVTTWVQDHAALAAVADIPTEHLTNWINSMDEATVASLWQASKFCAEDEGLSLNNDAEAYWARTTELFERSVYETQPNSTSMQKSLVQLSDSELTKSLLMFRTQRFQNLGIMVDAVNEYKASLLEANEHTKAEQKEALKGVVRAIPSQMIAALVIGVIGVGKKLVRRQVDDYRDDETGEFDGGKAAGDVVWQGLDSLISAAPILYEGYTLIENGINGKDYSIISVGGIDMANDALDDMRKVVTYAFPSDEEETEKQRATRQANRDKYIRKVFIYDLPQLVEGIPTSNLKNMAQAVSRAWQDIDEYGLKEGAFAYEAGAGVTTTQEYTRLTYALNDYSEAITTGDDGGAEVAKATMQKAMKQLGTLGVESYDQRMAEADVKRTEGDLAAAKTLEATALSDERKILVGVLKLQKEDEDSAVAKAAEAQLNGDSKTREDCQNAALNQMYVMLDIDPTAEADKARRTQAAERVSNAVQDLVDAGLGKDTTAGTTVYTSVLEALSTGDVSEAQSEIDTLVTAGKSDSAIKEALSGAYKQEYIDGTDADREEIIDLLTGLQNSEGKAYYTVKQIRDWAK